MGHTVYLVELGSNNLKEHFFFLKKIIIYFFILIFFLFRDFQSNLLRAKFRRSDFRFRLIDERWSPAVGDLYRLPFEFNQSPYNSTAARFSERVNFTSFLL